MSVTREHFLNLIRKALSPDWHPRCYAPEYGADVFIFYKNEKRYSWRKWFSKQQLEEADKSGTLDELAKLAVEDAMLYGIIQGGPAMNRSDFDKLERDIKDCESDLNSGRAKLRNARATCQHKWGDIRYTPEYREAYTTPGDPPGTMGVDWRGPSHVPAMTIKKWTRICDACGLAQTTTYTKREYTQGQVAGTGGKIDVPSFPSR